MLTFGFDFIRYLAVHSNFGDFEIDHEIKTRKYVQQARMPKLITSIIPSSAEDINWYRYFIRNIDYTFVLGLI